MNNFFKNKINLFLLTVFSFSCVFFYILNVEANHQQFALSDDEKSGALQLEMKPLVALGVDGDTPSTLPKYALRATGEMPLGYVDSTLIRCFIEMQPVSFEPRYKYYQESGSTSTGRLYGFSIPLVGDLNGDGKPEIVGLGYNGAGVNESSSYIYIFNGQTGEVIVQFSLPSSTQPVPSGYHGSPSQIAIVDADRNGKAEIIFASNYASDNCRKTLLSWEVNENTFNPSYGATNNNKLSPKWMSDVRYDMYGINNSTSGTNHFSYPLPQVVDIDADGTPEVIVYNKIYNAATGRYIMRFEELGSDISSKTAYIGSSGNEQFYYEYYIAFPTIYDIDKDGKYDYIAGGKIYYDIDLLSKTYKILDFSQNVKDGRTGVADVNGDGIPDVVVSNYSYRSGTQGTLQLFVWTPDFVNSSGVIIAKHSLKTYDAHSQGNHSYLFIGDIDGKEQNGKKYPEISFLTARPYLTADREMRGIPVHPNVVDGGITTNKSLSSSADGAILAYTWDNTEGLTIEERLKVSFMLEHEDRSVNTGFTLFDFDNDGVQDICYRDEKTLRIISAGQSYVKLNETNPNIIRFKSNVASFTGYEYPVIADIDGDASADMIVIGRNSTTTDNASGYIFAIEGKNRNLAPAPKVWNQFMYSPLKINEDLTTPKETFNPLSDKFRYYKNESDSEPIYIYNTTVGQVPVFSVNNKGVMKPIVRVPDAKLTHVSINLTESKLKFCIKNTGDATLNSTISLRVYVEGSFTPIHSSVVGGGGIFAGDSIPYSFSLTSAQKYETLYVLVGGTIDTNHQLIPDEAVNDCNWADNMETVATFLPKDDAVTVMQYSSVLIDVLKNDIFQTACQNQELTTSKINTPGGNGVMSGAFGKFAIVGNKLNYTAPANYEGGVVKASYTLTCENVQKTAHIYIYVVESASSGFASCAGSAYNVSLKENPAGVKFDWFDSNGEYTGTSAPTIPNLVTDEVFYVKPKFNGIASSPYRTVDFEKGKLSVYALNSNDRLTLKWTGSIDSDWNNPANWVQVLLNRDDAPVLWSPTGCVNVVIPGDVERYPELTSTASCNRIHLDSRAMIAGIHHLSYSEASVDFKPVAAEKNRFVMWSAPLKDMYTGDYHFLNTNDTPNWGYVYMNFFQSTNPDYSGSVEREKTFTATFGSTGTPLPLGTAFNVEVMTGNDGGFAFPKLAASYTDAKGNSSGALTRTNAKRFITDGALSADGALSLPVNGENQFSLIQVVNPFMAYLNMGAFLGANSSVLSGSFSIWNGDVNADFVTVLPYDDEDGEQRFVIDDSGLQSTSAGYIPPLQSFFVAKKDRTMRIESLSMNSATMTSTDISSANGNTMYVLRSATRGAAEAASLLRITANQGDKANSTVLLRRKGAEQAYKAGEDAGKAFNYGAPISVYSLSGSREAIAINASDDFSADVKLGIRLRNTAVPVSLSFDGLDGFGRKVYLVDHALANKVVDLEKENTYTFIAGGQSPSDVTELNDRFSLRFGANATGLEDVLTGDISVRSYDNYVSVSSSSIFNRVEIVNMSGYKVYDSIVPTQYVRVPLPTGQVYIVKVTQGDKISVKKILLD